MNIKLHTLWLNRSLASTLRVACTFYVFLAVLYTTNHFLSPFTYDILGLLPESLSHPTAGISNIFDTLIITWDGKSRFGLAPGTISGSSSSAYIRDRLNTPSALNETSNFLKHAEDVIYWDAQYPVSQSMSAFITSAFRKKTASLSSDNLDVNGSKLKSLKVNKDTSMPASLFLSKAFSVSHENLAYMDQPNLDIVPYYYRANSEHEKEDITITTLVTRNRFEIFRQLVERYQGPISVTVHVSKAELSASSFFFKAGPKERSEETHIRNEDNGLELKKKIQGREEDRADQVTKRKGEPQVSSFGDGKQETEEKKEREINFLDALHKLYTSTPLMSKYVDVHLVLTPAPGDRQFNAWRNIARFFARTNYVMMLDVDFVPCTNFRKRVREALMGATGYVGGDKDRNGGGRPMRKKGKGKNKKGQWSWMQEKNGVVATGEGKEEYSIQDLLRAGLAALVIPAFEYTNHEDGYDVSRFPSTKEELKGLYEKGEIGMFHRSWEYGHNGTDYERWVFGVRREGEVYKVKGEDYQYAYEPYVVFRREGLDMGFGLGMGMEGMSNSELVREFVTTEASAGSRSKISTPPRMIPWCDERFVGYGGNKAACLYEMYLSGVDFYVLGDDFLVHRSHGYDESARRAERRYNRRIYRDFREEVCLRYLYAYLRDGGNSGIGAEGELEMERAGNVIEECKKIKGVARVVAMLLEGR